MGMRDIPGAHLHFFNSSKTRPQMIKSSGELSGMTKHDFCCLSRILIHSKAGVLVCVIQSHPFKLPAQATP